MNSTQREREVYERWRLYYDVHAKSIAELDPQIYTVVWMYAIKRMYEDLGKQGKCGETMRRKVEEFFKGKKLLMEYAERIAKEFKVGKFCVYEDYMNLIEIVFEKAEDAYEKINNDKDENDYLKVIVVYRLLIDLIDLVLLWKQKDENICKFQLLCKRRVVAVYEIMSGNNNSRKEKQGNDSLEQELNDLAIEDDDDNDKDAMKTDQELIEEFTNETKKNKQQSLIKSIQVHRNNPKNKSVVSCHRSNISFRKHSSFIQKEAQCTKEIEEMFKKQDIEDSIAHSQLPLHNNIIDINAQYDFMPYQPISVKPFKKVSSAMLSKFQFKPIKPIKYHSGEYDKLMTYLKTDLILKTKKDINEKEMKKALQKSEMVLHLICNIVPKEDE